MYRHFCPHIPMFLPHFDYHTLHVVPFLIESQCIRRWVRQAQPEASVTMFNTTRTEPDNLHEQDMDHEHSTTIPTVDRFFVPICVMETLMRNPYHCYVKHDEWKGGENKSCPPYIQRSICHSQHMHEGAACIVNMTDESYEMCTGITPYSMQRAMLSHNKNKQVHFVLLLSARAGSRQT